MVVWPKICGIASIFFSSATGLGVYFAREHNYNKTVVRASWMKNDIIINPCAVWDENWDYRNPTHLVDPMMVNSPQEENRYNNELEKLKSNALRHIILIRHGEYLEVGPNDKMHNLTERGRLQAKYTAKRLSELGITWNECIVSTMTRAQETAHIIFKEINFDPKKAINCNYIREGAPISPQPPVSHWKPEKSFFRDSARIEAGFRRYFYRANPLNCSDTYTLIIGHSNVIRYFVCRALQFPAEAWLRISINHASITWLTIYPCGKVIIKCLGDSGFIPSQYLTNVNPSEVKNVN